MLKSLKLCFGFLVASIIISMPVVHALPPEENLMYRAICDYYVEIGLSEDNIAGSANKFVNLLNENANDFQGLKPDQVRNLLHPDRNDLNKDMKNKVYDLSMTAIQEYVYFRTVQELTKNYPRIIQDIIQERVKQLKAGI